MSKLSIISLFALFIAINSNIFSIDSEDLKQSSCFAKNCSNPERLICEKVKLPATAYIPPNSSYLNSAVFNNLPLHTHKKNMGNKCFTLKTGYRLNRSTKGYKIAKAIFGNDQVSFKGSLVRSRQDTYDNTRAPNKRPTRYAIRADEFGLSPLYEGSITFDPQIKEHLFDLHLRWRPDNTCCWLNWSWIDIKTTLVHANWTLNGKICEKNHPTQRDPLCGQTVPSSPYPGYVNKEGYEPIKTLAKALEGKTKWGNLKNVRKYHQINVSKKGLNETKLANISLAIGRDFYRSEDYHAGVFLITSAPTGTKQDSQFNKKFFHPMIGNGHYWEIGAGLEARYNLFACDTKCLDIQLSGTVTHLLRNKKVERIFDLDFSDKLYQEFDLNRFLLVKEFKAKTNDIDSDSNTEYESTGNFEPAINFTKRKIQSSFTAQGDMVFRVQYSSCGFSGGIGYKIYGRTKEKIKELDSNFHQKCSEFKYAIKGVQGMFSKEGVNWEKHDNNTQTDFADIFFTYDKNGRSITPRTESNKIEGNCKNSIVKDGGKDGTEIPGSINWDNFVSKTGNPKFLDKLYKNKLPRQIEHTFFTDVSYVWKVCNHTTYFNLGASYSLGKICDLQTPNRWSLWAHLGTNL